MTNRFAAVAIAVAVGLPIAAVPLFAHHGGAALQDDEIELKGTVVAWLWSNPHCLLQFDVTDENGKVVRWVAETTNPPELTRSGWSRSSFKAGDRISAFVRPAKSGKPVGGLRRVVLPSGQVLQRDDGQYSITEN
jgi:hypothetical protein